MLLLLPQWLDILGQAKMVGTFRHPSAVAQSLARRSNMPAEQAYALWLQYNQHLIEMHRRWKFPLLEFSLTDLEAYCASVAGVAVRLGINPRLDQIRRFVSQKLDHGEPSVQPVPTECRGAYEYLMDNRYTPDPFEKQIVDLSCLSNSQQEAVNDGMVGRFRNHLRRLSQALARKPR